MNFKLNDEVEVLTSNKFHNEGDTGVIISLIDDCDVGINCVVDFSGNNNVLDDGIWWVELGNLKLKGDKGVNN